MDCILEDDDGRNTKDDVRVTCQSVVTNVRQSIGKIITQIDEASLQGKQHGKVSLQETLPLCFSDIKALEAHMASALYLSAIEQGVLIRRDHWFRLDAVFTDVKREYANRHHSMHGIVWTCLGDSNTNNAILVDHRILSITVTNALDRLLGNTAIGNISVMYGVEKGDLLIEVHDRTNLETANLHSISEGERGRADIGILLIQLFVQYLGGTVAFVKSNVHGSNISIRIPVIVKDLGRDQLPTLAGTNHTLADGVVEPRQGTNTCIVRALVIASDALNMRYLKECLASENLRCGDVTATVCHDPVKAIIEIEESKYDILVISNEMDGMDGLHFLEFIDASENRCKGAVKIIIDDQRRLSEKERRRVAELSGKVHCETMTAESMRNLVEFGLMKSVSRG